MTTAVATGTNLNIGAGEQVSLMGYGAMSDTELARLRSQVSYTFNVLPDNIALVGGGALRLWLDQLGLPVPKPVSGDLDLVTWGGRPPNPGIDTLRPPAGNPVLLDIYHTDEPKEAPFFTHTSFDEGDVLVGTLPRILLMKARDVVYENPDPQATAKDNFYFGILKQLVARQEMDDFLAAYMDNSHPHLSIEAAKIATFLKSQNLITKN